MTAKQGKLVRYWVCLIVLIAIGGYISFSNIEYKQVANLVLLVVFALVSMFQDFSYYTGFGDGSKRIGEFIEKRRLLKYWLVIFCLLLLPFMVYKIATTKDDGVAGALYFVSFLSLIGPVFVVSEIERFRKLG